MTDAASADLSRIVEAAREHYHNIKTDIENAKDRIEHIRLTALAQEAHNLLTDLSSLHAGSVAASTETFNGAQQDPLDLPEFKSPYKPQDPDPLTDLLAKVPFTD